MANPIPALPSCARCGHGAQYHALTEKPPRVHKVCTVHEGGAKCECRQFVTVAS